MSNKLYTMRRSMASQLQRESEENISIIQDNLNYFLSQEIVNPRIIAILCDLYSSNFHVKSEIGILLEQTDAPEPEPEHEDEEAVDQIPLGPETLMVLETALISRYQMAGELAKYNISIVLN